MHAIFKVPVENKGKIDQLLKDDLVSRQSITVRDAAALSMEGKETFVLIEGSEEALEKADELFRGVHHQEDKGQGCRGRRGNGTTFWLVGPGDVDL
jgi:hypothetical protein